MSPKSEFIEQDIAVSPDREPLTIDFIWNSHHIIITRRETHDYSMSIFPPNNDGTFQTKPIHSIDGITTLLKIRALLENFFESKII